MNHFIVIVFNILTIFPMNILGFINNSIVILVINTIFVKECNNKKVNMLAGFLFEKKQKYWLISN